MLIEYKEVLSLTEDTTYMQNIIVASDSNSTYRII